MWGRGRVLRSSVWAMPTAYATGAYNAGMDRALIARGKDLEKKWGELQYFAGEDDVAAGQRLLAAFRNQALAADFLYGVGVGFAAGLVLVLGVLGAIAYFLG